MIIPTSFQFFLSQNSGITRVSGEKKKKEKLMPSRPLTYLAEREVLSYLSLQTRQKLMLEYPSLKGTNDLAPCRFETCTIGDNIIEFDFSSSWTFTEPSKMKVLQFGWLKKEYDMTITKEESMEKLVKFYMNRRGTTIKKLFIRSKNALEMLKSLGITEKFAISNKDGVNINDVEEDLDDVTLSKMEWKLVDLRQ